ncbi:hypothetical protein [Cryptosporangium sp. NPDC048952]|uniref:hypothetical protein n=1 Tax=Cryptosporangium sp. NPDC048952 TaxID=3363961 RepID=UPI0037194F45
MDESTTRMLLDRVLAEAPPPAPVDYDRVAEIAESRRSYRVRSFVAAAAAAVLVVTVTVAAFAHKIDGERAAPPAYQPAEHVVEQPGLSAFLPENRAPVENGLPPTAPKRFDPARSVLKISGVPDSLTDRGTLTSTTALVVYAYSSEPYSSVSVSVTSLDSKRPAPIGNAPRATTSGPTIFGHPSTWDDMGDGEYALRWQWAQGAWAYVTVRAVKDPLNLATRVAKSISVDLTAQTRLPYTVTTPKGFELAEFQTTASPTASPAATVAFAGPASTFISTNANTLGNGIGAPTETYQDRPTRVTQQQNYTTVVMAASDLKVTGTCNYRATKEITSGDFRELCRATTASVERTADITQPSNWPPYAPR